MSIPGFEISLDISLEVSWYIYFLRSDAEGGFFLEKKCHSAKSVYHTVNCQCDSVYIYIF